MAQVTLRTIRYYDKENILKPTYVNESGTRFYTDQDFIRLQQILLLKYLGFSLADIRDIIFTNIDNHMLADSLQIQLKLIQDKIEQLKLVESAIIDTTQTLKHNTDIDWNQALNLIHLTNAEHSLQTQYLDASNISARINLHQNYSMNPQGWFSWVYEQCPITNHIKVLELGCGDGSLWSKNLDRLPSQIEITLTDISQGMLRDAKRSIGPNDTRFHYELMDCHHIPYEENSYDIIIANHVLFYCDNIPLVCEQISHVLKPNGIFICSTYGNKHMQEITNLVQQFDNRINLSSTTLYENFGYENGETLLAPYFQTISWCAYDDTLVVPDVDPLISYILSCHGNQNQHLLERYNDFYRFASSKVKNGYKITKDAGLFISCNK